MENSVFKWKTVSLSGLSGSALRLIEAPRESKNREPELKREEGETVAASGKRIFANIRPVVTKVFNDLAASSVEGFSIEVRGLKGGGINHNHLTEDTEASVHAALLSKILEMELGIGVLCDSPLEKVVTHLIGKINQVEFA